MSRVRNRTLRLAQIAMLTALLILTLVPPLNQIKITAFYIVLSFLPVSIGAIVFGPRIGALLGLFWGIGSFFQALAGMDNGMLYINYSVLLTLFALIVPRVLAGLLTGLLFLGTHRLLKKAPAGVRQVSFLLASAATPLINSVLFLSAIYLCFSHFFPAGFLALIGMVVSVNSLTELIIGIVVGTTLSATMYHVVHKRTA